MSSRVTGIHYRFNMFRCNEGRQCEEKTRACGIDSHRQNYRIARVALAGMVVMLGILHGDHPCQIPRMQEVGQWCGRPGMIGPFLVVMKF